MLKKFEVLYVNRATHPLIISARPIFAILSRQSKARYAKICITFPWVWLLWIPFWPYPAWVLMGTAQGLPETFHQGVRRPIPNPLASGVLIQTCIAFLYCNQNIDKTGSMLRFTEIHWYTFIRLCKDRSKDSSAWTFDMARIIIFVSRFRVKNSVKAKLNDKQVLSMS